MTEKRRLEAAEKFRALLDDGVHRKEAIRQVCSLFDIGRATLYRFCKRFGIETT